MKVFRFILPRWRAALLIILFLGLQAASEMSLPSYMSRLVDVGIQQGGIESPLAERLSAQSYADLLLLTDAEHRPALEAAYAEQNGAYVLRSLDRQSREALEAAVQKPAAALFMLHQQGGLMLTALRAGAAGEGLLQQLESMGEAQGQAMPELYVKQAAVQFVRSEYERLGMDMNGIQQRYLWRNGLIMLLLTLAMGAAAVAGSFVGSRTAASIGRDLRQRVFHQVIGFSKAEIDKFSTASLITRSGNDIRQVEHASVMTLRMFLYAPIMGIIGIWRVSQLKSGLSWILVVAVVLASALVLLLAGKAVPLFKRIQELVDRQNLVLREILTGLPVIRAFTRERHEEERFQAANLDLIGVIRKMNGYFIILMPAMMFVMNLTMVSIVWFGGQGIDAGSMQVGSMMAMISYSMYVIMAFMMLSMGALMLPRANVSTERILEVLHTRSSIHDPAVSAQMPGQWEGRVRFEDVSFRFPGANEDVLHGIDLEALPGQMTAIIGGTGSGKSTLLNLIPRMYDVTGGRITIDGHDVRDMPLDTLRGLVGYVPQQALLFSGDIKSNITFGQEDLPQEKVERAARIAQAESFIAEKEGQYQSAVAQGGTNVSGGQRQRLSIARALAAEPRILLFDDSFSALDYQTDLKLRRALRSEMQHATVLIVAQRIATVMKADKILVLENGRVVGQGTHSQLMQDCPTYLEIARSQLSEEELQEGGQA